MITPDNLFDYMDDKIHDLLSDFMYKYGEYIGDAQELEDLVSSAVEHYIVSSDEFYTE